MRDFARKNHTIYDYSPERIAKFAILDGMHPKTIERYVNTLIGYNLVEIHNGNLFFRNQINLIRHTFNLRKYTLTCPFYYPEVVDELYKLVILLNKTQQEYNITTKNADGVSIEAHDVCFSTRSIGRLLGISHTTANKIVKHLVERSKIKAFQIIQRLRKISFEEFSFLRNGLNSLKDGYYFFRNGYLLVHRGLRISVGH